MSTARFRRVGLSATADTYINVNVECYSNDELPDRRATSRLVGSDDGDSADTS